ncbi:hypothetical protein [Campylobacter molothri]|uniref:hypothetical protein n=1 Tax=Campylobacter molothri TaxID=1032242 RepID=UPI001D92F326|nr:hypothetical protein [Campylobacter sp. RM9929]MBZ7960106.1 hypothetical protein [Campylobacter sp. RM12397]MBZ7965928.1 hypothetical protein [Campylobacter sp. RM10535]
MKKMLFAIVAVFFIACGGDKLVKFEYEKGNKELFEKANNLIKEKYPNYNLYSWKSLENISSIQEAKYKMNTIEDSISNQEYCENNEEHYCNYILLEKNRRYRLIEVKCDKAYSNKNAFGVKIKSPDKDKCEIMEIPILQK